MFLSGKHSSFDHPFYTVELMADDSDDDFDFSPEAMMREALVEADDNMVQNMIAKHRKELAELSLQNQTDYVVKINTMKSRQDLFSYACELKIRGMIHLRRRNENPSWTKFTHHRKTHLYHPNLPTDRCATDEEMAEF